MKSIDVYDLESLVSWPDDVPSGISVLKRENPSRSCTESIDSNPARLQHKLLRHDNPEWVHYDEAFGTDDDLAHKDNTHVYGGETPDFEAGQSDVCNLTERESNYNSSGGETPHSESNESDVSKLTARLLNARVTSVDGESSESKPIEEGEFEHANLLPKLSDDSFDGENPENFELHGHRGVTRHYGTSY
jgi:hypothetical protein